METALTQGPTYQTLLYEISDDHVATVTLDRPDAMNAFNRTMCDEFRNVWKHVRDDDDVHAVSTSRAPTASPTTSGTTRIQARHSAPSGTSAGSRSSAPFMGSAPRARSTS
jgi:1,4-dihydroxy-2-naphthoyl-CoA synthase